MNLPSLTVQAKAEMITNNLPAFEEAFRKGLEGLKYELLTDNDFAKAKDDIASLKEAEKEIKAVDQEIVNGSADIKTLRETLAKLGEEARQFRLSREKEVKSRDEEIKAEIIDEALSTIDHAKRERFRSELEDAVKGKRGENKFANMKKSADKFAQSVNDKLKTTRKIIAEFVNLEGAMLVPDKLELELYDAERLESELRHRLEKKRDEEEKAKLKKEAEKAKKEAEEAKVTEEEVAKDSNTEHGNTALIDTDETPGKTPAQPAPKPSSPAPDQVESPKEEMALFLSAIESAFTPVREARAQLKHLENIEAAGEFAKSLGELWVNFKSKVS